MAIAHEQVDVVVWGGGTGGVAAALQAARGGADTLLLTPGAWLGGMVSAAGVCCPRWQRAQPLADRALGGLSARAAAAGAGRAGSQLGELLRLPARNGRGGAA